MVQEKKLEKNVSDILQVCLYIRKRRTVHYV